MAITEPLNIQMKWVNLRSVTSVPNFKILCNSIPELLNVFEDPAECVYTIAALMGPIIDCKTFAKN